MYYVSLFWHPAGPDIRYEWDFAGEYLAIYDLNPENKIRFRMTPFELLRFGLKCIYRAMAR